MKCSILPAFLVLAGCNTVDTDFATDNIKRAAVDSLAGYGTYDQAMLPRKENLDAELAAVAATPPSNYPTSHQTGADGLFDVRIDLPDDAARDFSQPSTRPLRRQVYLYGKKICGGREPFAFMASRELPEQGPMKFRVSCIAGR